MKFNFPRNTKTIKEICDAFEQEVLIIDNSYQRRKVWLPQDKIRLVETILLNLIIPEIFLWNASTDPDNGNTIYHIVDGQQRINAIVDFISNKFQLNPKYLLDETIKANFSNLYFENLPSEIKRDFWSYNLSIVNIDRECTKDNITNLFYRLNLTNYSLNEQEKRNSLSSEFGRVSEELTNHIFWDSHKIFSPTDIRRMKDVEFCSNILILAREGIIDQTTQEKLNQVYDTFKEDYPTKETDIEKVNSAIDMIEQLTNEKTCTFISKKTQTYSVFSFVFDLINHSTKITNEIIDRFSAFVEAYNNFKNGIELSFDQKELTQVYESIKQYKLASSEGLNKINNRMIRFEILKKTCLNQDPNLIEYFNIINQRLLKAQ